MFFTKLKIAAAFMLMLTLMGLGSGLLARQGAAQSVTPAPTPKAEARTADGKVLAAEKNPAVIEPASKHKGRRDLEMRDALRAVVKYDGDDDPQSTLADLLSKIQDKYNVQFDVNEQAFRFEAPDQDVLRTEVASPPIPPFTATLDTVLRNSVPHQHRPGRYRHR